MQGGGCRNSFLVPSMMIAKGTSDGPQHDIGRYSGLCSAGVGVCLAFGAVRRGWFT